MKFHIYLVAVVEVMMGFIFKHSVDKIAEPLITGFNKML